MRKVLPVLGGLALVLLIPSPALANGRAVQESSNVNVPLVVTGGVIAGAGVLLWGLKKGGRWVAPLAVAIGLVVLGVGFFLRLGGGEEVSSDAAVSIVQPSNGERVDAGKPVTVRVALQNATIATSPTDEDGGHLHLYLDGRLQQMPYTMEATIEVPAGTHQLKVEFVDHRHISFDPEVQTTITVTAE